jgi:NTE family protein
MDEHWASGLEDMRRSFGHPEWFEIPGYALGFVTNDVHRHDSGPQSALAAIEPVDRASEEQSVDLS